MKKLSELLQDLDYTLLQGNVDTLVEDIIYDSRKVKDGTAFVCMVGAVSDGHKYIPDAIDKGASVLVVEHEVEVSKEVTVILVPSARRALSFMSAAFFDYPAKKMTTIGITGTKGKTTTSHIMRTMIEHADKKCGVIGTIGAFIGEKELETHNTTPESYELQKLFYQMVQEKTEFLVMEVSSQGLKLDRTLGIEFDYGVFENLSPDHIGPNEHADFEEYLECKSRLFKQCKTGIVNSDDEHWKEIIAGATCEIITFGTGADADLRANQIEHVIQGGDLAMKFRLEGMIKEDVIVGLPGRFNVFNAMCAICVCEQLGIPREDILHVLKHVKVRGRVEAVPVSEDFTVLIDYAHNEVSSRSVLTTLREYNPGRIVSIFGCGGNRSKIRRYTMGEAIGELSDLSIITADNSRNEDVMDIIEDIKVGMAKSNGAYIEIPDRQEATTYAIRHAQKGDLIILLGKGHEDYQEVNGVFHHYSDREAVLRAMEEVFGKDIKF